MHFLHISIANAHIPFEHLIPPAHNVCTSNISCQSNFETSLKSSIALANGCYTGQRRGASENVSHGQTGAAGGVTLADLASVMWEN